MRNPGAAGGVTRGRVPEDPRPPPGLPPAAAPPRRPAGSHGMRIDDVVREMAGAYARAAGPRLSRALLMRMDGPWRHVVRLMASDLMDEGRSGGAYVRFVVASCRALRGRTPFAAEVFSLRSFQGWLPIYRREASSWLDRPGYLAGPARRRLHEGRMPAWQAPTA